MALTIVRNWNESLLKIHATDADMYDTNHIFEPEFHQARYVEACESIKKQNGSFQLGSKDLLKQEIMRGTQPKYEDIEEDPESLQYEGMLLSDGTRQKKLSKDDNVCALKSNCIREGFIDTSLARSVSRAFYEKVKNKAGVEKNDILINSTGDGTIGRVAVYNYDFPAVVDGHITIVRFKDAELAWYVAAFLMTEKGQDQIYRYINGSSGQVEIYPQDIERIWISDVSDKKKKEVYQSFLGACEKHEEFYSDLKAALNKV